MKFLAGLRYCVVQHNCTASTPVLYFNTTTVQYKESQFDSYNRILPYIVLVLVPEIELNYVIYSSTITHNESTIENL